MTTRMESENARIIHDDRGNEFREIVTFDKKPNGVGIDSLCSILKIYVPRITPIASDTSPYQDFPNAILDQLHWNGNRTPTWTNNRINLGVAGIYLIQVTATVEYASFESPGDRFGLALYRNTGQLPLITQWFSKSALGPNFNGQTQLISLNYMDYFSATDAPLADFQWTKSMNDPANTLSTLIIYTIIKML